MLIYVHEWSHSNSMNDGMDGARGKHFCFFWGENILKTLGLKNGRKALRLQHLQLVILENTL